MGDFFDSVSGLCAKEWSAATKLADRERIAGVVEALSTMLGRSIATACLGDAEKIEVMLTGVENHVASEAAGMAGIIQLSALKASRKATP